MKQHFLNTLGAQWPGRKTVRVIGSARDLDMTRGEARQLTRYALAHDILANLAWSYIDTVIKVASDKHISELKEVARRLRQAQRAYEQQRHSYLLDDISGHMAVISDGLEEECEVQLNQLCFGVANDRSASGLEGPDMMLVKSVQMAMTILDAIAANDRLTDTYISSHHISDTARRYNAYFVVARQLVPLFAGDCYAPRLEARRIVARFVHNKALAIAGMIVLTEKEEQTTEITTR